MTLVSPLLMPPKLSTNRAIIADISRKLIDLWTTPVELDFKLLKGYLEEPLHPDWGHGKGARGEEVQNLFTLPRKRTLFPIRLSLSLSGVIPMARAVLTRRGEWRGSAPKRLKLKQYGVSPCLERKNRKKNSNCSKVHVCAVDAFSY